MKSAVITTIALILLFASVQAQDPANFHIIYGNRDGTPLPVPIGSLIEVPIWGATDPTPGNPDTVTFMHDPLAANGMYIVQRNGGFGIPECDTFINGGQADVQIHRRSAYMHDPRNPECMFYTLGDTMLIATFLWTTANDPSLIGQTVCPFFQGDDIGPLWGMQDGVRGVIPTATYGCLYFTAACEFMPGDVNDDGVFDGRDIVYFVNFLKGYGLPPPVYCYCGFAGWLYPALDFNGSCSFNGIDVTYGVNYFRGGGPPPGACPECL